MGSKHVGTLPNTQPWRKVVKRIADDEDVASIASATAKAAAVGLNLAQKDIGLIRTIQLLSEIAEASRADNFGIALRDAGYNISGEINAFDIASGLLEKLDHHLYESRSRTDIGEIAGQAAAQSLLKILTARSSSLFQTGENELHSAAKSLSTEKGFGTLVHEFFSAFTARFLTYHLDRELANHVGGNGRFAGVTEQLEFQDELATHCRESAYVVKDYAGGWYSKANYEGGITRQRSANFVDYAIKKLRGQLNRRGSAT